MSKELKVGLIALISGIILYYGFNYLKGIDFFSPTDKYYVIYDNVDGLNKSNPVIINGLSVGRVSKIQLMQNNSNHILVELDIDKSIVLGDSTVASLSNLDFLGSKGIVLTVGPLDSPIEPGDTLISYRDKGLSEILESATPVANNLSVTISRVNEILLGLKGSGEKINTTLGELQVMSERVNRILGKNEEQIYQISLSAKEVLGGLSDKLEQFDPILAKTNGVLDSLNALELNRTLAGVNSAVNSLNNTLIFLQNEEGTLGKIVTDDSLYNNLNGTILDLRQLINHMNRYPKHFFGPLGKSHEKILRDLNKED